MLTEVREYTLKVIARQDDTSGKWRYKLPGYNAFSTAVFNSPEEAFSGAVMALGQLSLIVEPGLHDV